MLAAVPEAAEVTAWQAALEPRVREFEEAMLARALEKAQETSKNKDLLLSENGAQAMADMFKMYKAMAGTGGPPEKQ